MYKKFLYNSIAKKKKAQKYKPEIDIANSEDGPRTIAIATWATHSSFRRNCLFKGPEAALCLWLSRSSREARVGGMNEKKVAEDTLREANLELVSYRRDFGFYLEWYGEPSGGFKQCYGPDLVMLLAATFSLHEAVHDFNSNLLIHPGFLGLPRWQKW